MASKKDGSQHHRGDDGYGVGLEEVRRHACAVTHVVTDVVGNGCGIARVVFRNAGLDFTDEIAADVSAFCKDAAAETCEDRNERCAEAQRDKRVDDVAATWLLAETGCEERVVDGNTQQRQACNQKAGDRTGLECDVKALGERDRRRLGGSNVGPHRHVHADEACEARQDRANQKSKCLKRPEKQPRQYEDDHADDANRAVLSVEIGLRTFAHGCSDFLHPGIALVGAHHSLGRYECVEDRQRPAGDDPPKYIAH